MSSCVGMVAGENKRPGISRVSKKEAISIHIIYMTGGLKTICWKDCICQTFDFWLNCVRNPQTLSQYFSFFLTPILLIINEHQSHQILKGLTAAKNIPVEFLLQHHHPTLDNLGRLFPIFSRWKRDFHFVVELADPDTPTCHTRKKIENPILDTCPFWKTKTPTTFSNLIQTDTLESPEVSTTRKISISDQPSITEPKAFEAKFHLSKFGGKTKILKTRWAKLRQNSL